jgi:hypothetical protein
MSRGGKRSGIELHTSTFVENALIISGTDAFTSSTDILKNPAPRSF